MDAKLMKKSVKTYIGIDFSKEKFNACLLTDCGVMGEGEFENTKGGYLKFVRWAKKTSELGRDFCPEETLVCGEHTGTYSTGLSEYLYEKGYLVWLENAYAIKCGSGLVRAKNDRADAEMIAYYAQRFFNPEKILLFTPESQDLKALRSLYNFRNRTVC